MSPRDLQIVAIIFVAVLLVFFMILVIRGKELDDTAFSLVRFLAAICAGFAGGLFLGSITVSMTVAGRFAVSGAGGAACFALIWLTFGSRQLQGEWYNFSIPAKATFAQVASAMVEKDGGQLTLDPSFQPAELTAALKQGPVKARNLTAALQKLPSRATTPVRSVTVEHVPPTDYTLKPV